MHSSSWLHHGLADTIPTANQGAATNTAGRSWLPSDFESVFHHGVNLQHAPEDPSHAFINRLHRHTPSFREWSAERTLVGVACLALGDPHAGCYQDRRCHTFSSFQPWKDSGPNASLTHGSARAHGNWMRREAPPTALQLDRDGCAVRVQQPAELFDVLRIAPGLGAPHLACLNGV